LDSTLNIFWYRAERNRAGQWESVIELTPDAHALEAFRREKFDFDHILELVSEEAHAAKHIVERLDSSGVAHFLYRDPFTGRDLLGQVKGVATGGLVSANVTAYHDGTNVERDLIMFPGIGAGYDSSRILKVEVPPEYKDFLEYVAQRESGGQGGSLCRPVVKSYGPPIESQKAQALREVMNRHLRTVIRAIYRWTVNRQTQAILAALARKPQ
jgi:hypothetical protein